LGTIGLALDEKTQSHFFLSALQQKGIEINMFVDRLDNVPDTDPLPEELTLTELILRIKDIRSLNNSSPTIINRFNHSAPDSSSPHQHDRPPRQPRNPDARSDQHCQAGSDNHNDRPNQRPARPFSERTQTQFICGRWGHSVENCQQVAMHFLIAK
jgi:nicotinamidase-related amidase